MPNAKQVALVAIALMISLFMQPSLAEAPAASDQKDTLAEAFKSLDKTGKQVLLRSIPATIDRIETLPVGDLKAVMGQDGNVLYISENGRFVLVGQVYDNWDGKFLNSLDDVEDAATRIHLENLKVDLDKLNTISLGHGKRTVAVLTDPLCEVCSKLVAEARKVVKEQPEAYTFKFIVIPALGDKSNQLAHSLFCAKDKSHALDALANNLLGEMPQQENCNDDGYRQTLIFATFLGVKGVPMLIAPNGEIGQGMPGDLSAWLAARVK